MRILNPSKTNTLIRSDVEFTLSECKGLSSGEVFTRMNALAKINNLKGVRGECCHVTACQAVNSAHHRNSANQKWYCVSCARNIENVAQRRGDSFFQF